MADNVHSPTIESEAGSGEASTISGPPPQGGDGFHPLARQLLRSRHLRRPHEVQPLALCAAETRP
ncbi:cytochrome P450 [Histoplasma ohiense]|nr:cytochrome P450 [Histoplasma ohiense (nom. inval.)]